MVGGVLLPADVSTNNRGSVGENSTKVVLPPGVDWFLLNSTATTKGGQTVVYVNPGPLHPIYAACGWLYTRALGRGGGWMCSCRAPSVPIVETMDRVFSSTPPVNLRGFVLARRVDRGLPEPFPFPASFAGTTTSRSTSSRSTSAAAQSCRCRAPGSSTRTKWAVCSASRSTAAATVSSRWSRMTATAWTTATCR